MNWLQIVMIIYGVLMLGGGVMGYRTAHSIDSLVTGIESFVFLLLGSLYASRNQSAGFAMCLIVVLHLTVVFGRRCVETNFNPRNIGLLVLTLVMLGLLTFSHFQREAQLNKGQSNNATSNS